MTQITPSDGVVDAQEQMVVLILEITMLVICCWKESVMPKQGKCPATLQINQEPGPSH